MTSLWRRPAAAPARSLALALLHAAVHTACSRRLFMPPVHASAHPRASPPLAAAARRTPHAARRARRA
eukprot:4602852-Prymnesium_polylepis.1